MYHGRNDPKKSPFILLFSYPIASMDGIFTHIYHKHQPNVDINTPYMDGMGTAWRPVGRALEGP